MQGRIIDDLVTSHIRERAYVNRTVTCVRCGNPAVHTQRLVESEELVVVGASGMYEARCRRCFEPNPALAKEKKDAPLLIRNRAAGSS